MKKRYMLILFIVFMFPISVFAKENDVFISCSNVEIANGDEFECEIKASNLNFVVTNITGQIEVSDNLIINSSSYDTNNWMILDDEFNVNDINLISENRELKENIIVANFKVKAVNDKEDIGKIQFSNVVFGDERYEEHSIDVADLFINLAYNNEDDNIDDNPPTGNIYIFIIVCVAVLMLLIMKKNKNRL